MWPRFEPKSNCLRRDSLHNGLTLGWSLQGVLPETTHSLSHVDKLESSDSNLPLLNVPPKSCPDEELAYYDGKIYKSQDMLENVTCDTKNEIAILTVHGFGQIPPLMILAREKPKAW